VRAGQRFVVCWRCSKLDCKLIGFIPLSINQSHVTFAVGVIACPPMPDISTPVAFL
jgi:hypothetical protein